MRQMILHEPGSFRRNEVDPPTRGSGQALVQVKSIGVCGTDLNAFNGRQPFFEYPRVIGHELGVRILDIPPNDLGLNEGDRCSVEPYSACGECRLCRQGRRNCCPKATCLGVHVDGGMQDILTVPIDRLHPSSSLPFEQLALVETLGIGAHAVERAGIQQGDRVLIVGMGPIGVAALEFATRQDCQITVCERAEARQAFAARFEADVVSQLPDQDRFDVVIDATGNQESMETAFQSLDFGGTIVYVGIVLSDIRFNDPFFHRRELTIKATRNSAGVFPEIIKLLEEEAIDVASWITHRFSFDEIPTTFGRLRSEPSLLKAIISLD